ncbi:MAG: hypothetical protein KY451_04735 [Actinobacteria bacterium]|nr:hypothetical protein [Actinomycetota bacterium]MBW3646354.1 hypothetical protein [Actinomycetota bacterium]
MNVLTISRTAAALEYKALRYPSQLFETKVVAVLLSEQSSVRLTFERVLGSLDSTAGSLFADQGLKDRGRLLTRRVESVETAASLEAKAQQRKEQADKQLRSETEKAAAKKAQAQQELERKAQQARAEKAAAKQAAEHKAQARQKADLQAAAAKAEAALKAERQRAEEQKARIEAKEKAVTAAPKAQLDKAVEDTEAALEQRSDAERLAKLAEAEKANRQREAEKARQS